MDNIIENNLLLDYEALPEIIAKLTKVGPWKFCHAWDVNEDIGCKFDHYDGDECCTYYCFVERKTDSNGNRRIEISFDEGF